MKPMDVFPAPRPRITGPTKKARPATENENQTETRSRRPKMRRAPISCRPRARSLHPVARRLRGEPVFRQRAKRGQLRERAVAEHRRAPGVVGDPSGPARAIAVDE